jgi:hypothetical protein
MGETATDEWFVRVSGDDAISDLYIGRLPAKNSDEAATMVNKISAYEGSLNTKSWEKNVLLLADDQRDGAEYEYEANFEIMNNDVAALLPEAMNDPFKGYLNDYFDADDLSDEIIDQINSGTFMVNYSGHSSIQILANPIIFNNLDVAGLTNIGMYPLFVGMGCLSGHFVYPEDWNYPSLAEALLRAEDKGAAAALMSTGLTTTEGQHILDTALADTIFNQDIRILGQAVSSAKQTLLANGGALYDEVNETFLLFGDPAMTLKVPLPLRPEGLRAQGNGNAVDLSWDEATDCNGGAVAGYNLYRSTTPGGTYTQVNTSLITDNQYDDISVAAGTTYYRRWWRWRLLYRFSCQKLKGVMECWSIGVVERKVDHQMKSKKKEYKKPEVKRVSLDAKCAVLAVKRVSLDAKCAVLAHCKNSGTLGPDGADCGLPVPPCAGPGS